MLQILSCRMDVAAAYGADAAIFINNIVFWTLKNKAENRHYHEGRYWTYGTVAGFAKLYPLWSEPQLKRIISRCREAGILLTGDFNDDRRNRTGWYSPSDEILALYGDGIEELGIVRKRKMQSTISSDAQDEIGKSNKVQVAIQVDNTPLPPSGQVVKQEPAVAGRVEEYAAGDRDLQQAILGLLENRRLANHKPVKTLRAINGILRDLDKLSGSDRGLKLALLEKATVSNWLTVYPLKADEKTAQGPAPGKEQYGWQ